MALNFPPSPSVGQPFPDPPAPPRWVWNGTSWVSAPVSTALYLPLTGGTLTGPGNLTVRGLTHLDDDATVDGDVTVTGGVTADHVMTTGTSLDVSGSATIGGTLTVDGATEFKNTVEIQGEPVATEDWTMQQVAAGGLWQGIWDPATNMPDLTQTAVQLDGYTWAVVTSDPNASFTIPATPVIPGLNGKVVWTGYNVIWSDSASEFQIVPGGGMSLTAAQDMFLAKTGGTLAGPGGANGALTVNGDFQVGSPSLFKVNGTVFNVDTSGSAFFSNKASYYFDGPLNAKEIAFGVRNTPNNGPEISIGPMGHLIIQSGTNFDIIGTPMLNGHEIATQQYVQNNQVTLAGGLPITGGTLNGPGNLTVNGTFYHQGAAATTSCTLAGWASLYRNASGGNETKYFSCDRFQVSYYYQGAPTYRYQYNCMFGDAFSVTQPPYFPDPFPANVMGSWGNVVRFGGSEPCAISYGAYYEWGNQHYISLQNLGTDGGPGDGGLTYFINRPWYNSPTDPGWGTFFGSYGAAGYNPKIFSLGAGTGGTSQYIVAHNYAYRPGGGPFDALSDSRTKTDVHDYTAGLAELNKLNPIRFRYNGRARQQETGKSFVGLHAEEAKQVMPEMVYARKGKLDYDEDETDILYMNSNALAYATINALKEITKRLEALEAKLK